MTGGRRDERLFGGVDGGGTSSRLVITDAGGNALHREDGGPGLVRPGGAADAAHTVARLVRTAAGRLGRELPLDGLCAGLAGAGNPELRDAVEGALRRAGVARAVSVVSDAEIAFHAVFQDEPGMLLIAGTGSMAFGRGAHGRTARCGGWGAILGDEGGGHALGIAALRTALRVADGMEEGTGLVPAVLEAVGEDEASGLPAWALAASKAEVAALAPVVLRRAAAGDPTAGRIVERAADHLAQCASALARRLAPWPGPIPVAWTGGLTRDRLFELRLRGRIATLVSSARFLEVSVEPALGAAAMARRGVLMPPAPST